MAAVAMEAEIVSKLFCHNCSGANKSLLYGRDYDYERHHTASTKAEEDDVEGSSSSDSK